MHKPKWRLQRLNLWRKQCNWNRWGKQCDRDYEHPRNHATNEIRIERAAARKSINNLQASYWGLHNIESEENNNCDSDADDSLDEENLNSTMTCAPTKGSALDFHFEKKSKNNL